MEILNLMVWSAQIIGALIFLQDAYFKLTGAPSATYVYSVIGLEPWGRYVVGILNVLIAIAILVPVSSLYGAMLSIIVIIPAVIYRMIKVGIVIEEDKGLMFGLDIAVLVISALVLVARWPGSPLIA